MNLKNRLATFNVPYFTHKLVIFLQCLLLSLFLLVRILGVPADGSITDVSLVVEFWSSFDEFFLTMTLILEIIGTISEANVSHNSSTKKIAKYLKQFCVHKCRLTFTLLGIGLLISGYEDAANLSGYIVLLGGCMDRFFDSTKT